MTEFITYYNLCPIHNPNDFLGLSCDREEGNIITTFGRNMVVIIQINNQKQVRSWSTLEKLSSKVVYDYKSQKYVGVFGYWTIRCWNASDVDINKSKKFRFNKHIVDLVTYMETTLIVYADGTCEELNTAIQSRKNQESVKQQLDPSSEVTIMDPKVSDFSDGRKCMTMFEKDQNQETFTLVKIDLDSKANPDPSKEVQKFVIKRENLNVTVAGYAVIDGDSGPMLVTIWSDKRIFLLNLNDPIDPEKSPGNFVSMLNSLKVDTPLSIVGVSRHFIAIYGANSTQDGAYLLLYNTQFKVIKAKQFFKIYFDLSRLWAENGHILLAMGHNLSVVSYRISKERLSDFVGTQSCNNFLIAVENDHINEEDPFQENIQFVQSGPTNDTDSLETATSKNNTDSLKTAENSNAVYADGKIVPFETVSNFEKDFSAFNMSNMHVDVIQADEQCYSIQINLTTNVYDDGFSTNEVQMIAAQLEKCGASEHEISEKLLFVLINSNLLSDVAVCLRRYKNISEKMLVKTLKYVLNNISIEINNSSANHNSETEKSSTNNDIEEIANVDLLLKGFHNTPLIKGYADVLNAILCCSYDTSAITSHIRKEIDYPQVLFMMNYLYTIVTSERDYELEICGSEKDCIDVEPLVFRWFGIFLNTHFQKLVLSRSVHVMNILYKWHELFTLYKKEIVELRHVSSLLYNFLQRRQIIKEKSYSKWYSIEEVNLY